MKRLMCRECRFTPGIPPHIRAIVEAHNRRYELPAYMHATYDWYTHWRTAGLYTHPDMNDRSYTD